MVALKLNLKSNQILELCFKEDSVCSLKVGESNRYEFSLQDEEIKVCWFVKNEYLHEVNESDIESIQSIDYKFSGFVTSEKSLSNCCSIGEKEYCVKNGCMNAPCGRICD